jgi:iron complex outermembrane receptor protein
VVTAQRSEEKLQRVPVSITALTPQQLYAVGFTNVNQLTQLVPAIRTVPSQGAYTNFNLRGVVNLGGNAFASPAVITMADGVPLAHPTSSHGLFYDLQRIEVLKGPQGILYGRNATGGVVNVLSNRPADTLGGNVSADVGNYGRFVLSGALNLPVTDTLAVRVAGQRVRRDGYFSDGTDDEHAEAGRVSIAYTPSPTLSFVLIGDYAKEGGKGTGSVPLLTGVTRGQPGGDLVPVAGWRTGAFDPAVQSQYSRFSVPRSQGPFQDNHYWGVTLEANLETSFGTITLLPSHRVTKDYFLSNVPTFYFGEDAHTWQDSIEIRLNSGNDRPLRYLAGFFYLHDRIESHQVTEQSVGTLSNQDIRQTLKTGAVFGNLTYAIAEGVRITVGGRYTIERKDTDARRWTINPFNYQTRSITPFPSFGQGIQDQTPPSNSRTWKSATWKAGAEWEPRPGSLAYANVSTGFKAGGFFFGPRPNSYEPEKITAYVLGTKNQFSHDRLRLNAELFWYDYRDQQVGHFASYPAPFGNVSVTDNVGKATIKGTEVEVGWLAASNTRLNAIVQYLDARYDRFSYSSPLPLNASQGCPLVNGNNFVLDCSGKRMPQAPRWVIQGSIAQTFPLASGGSFVADLSSRWESKRITGLNYIEPEQVADAYTRTDASLTYNAPGAAWTVSVYVQNIENRDVIVQTLPGRSYSRITGGLFAATLMPPRTYGVRANLKF